MPTSPDLSSRTFGKTGLIVSPLAMGCAPLGDMPETFAYSVGDERALETVREVLRSAIKVIDTAASYGDGESERRIGLVLKEMGGVPEGYLLDTKADRDLKTGDFSGDQMRRSVERSLRLLGVDRLALVYLHDPEHAPFEEIAAPGGAVDTLCRLRDEGVIEHVGLAGGPTELMMRYLELGIFEAVISHNRYTLINRNGAPLLDLATRMGLGVANAAPYGSGILAKGPDAYARYAYQEAPAQLIERVRRIQEICGRHGVPLAAAALQFSMRDPRVHTTIIGFTRPERIQQTVDLAQHPIPDALWPELEAVGFDTGDPELYRWQ
ncbi:MAG: Aldo/keto reductase [uncultured Chloroflexi bacterium]|uniref:Aldo/keto reductase n=1 Tax=uncultured Chloroflexota bacterium TaxID=166587 RepID=A0A6J4I6K8_9CHLR|nr:MAG: Aldo/keto reductase [uncultured Chloroflexota bacterium]